MPVTDLLPSEDWTLQALRQGNVADFHARFSEIDPQRADIWDQARELRPEFLKRLAFDEALRAQLPPEGVRISGAWVTGSLDLGGARLAGPWRIERSRIDGAVCLRNSFASDDLSFGGTHAAGFDLADARVGGSLDLTGAAVAGDANLSRADIGFHVLFSHLSCGRLCAETARIGRSISLDHVRCEDVSMEDVAAGGPLLMEGAKVSRASFKRGRIGGHANLGCLMSVGSLNLEGVDIGSDLFLDGKVRVGSLQLTGARVQGQVAMDRLTSKGRVDLNGLGLREDLILTNARLKSLEAIDVNCGGQLNLEGLRCTGDADFQRLQSASDVFMNDAKVSGYFGLMSARIGADLRMESAKFGGMVDLQAIAVSGSLRMTEGAKFSGELNLTNASIGLELGMRNIEAEGAVIMNGAHAGSVYLTGAICSSVSMRWLKVDGVLGLTGARVSGLLDMSSSHVGDDIFLQNHACFNDIDLSDAQVRGTIVARRAHFHGTFKATAVSAGCVWLHAGAWFGDRVDFSDAQIAASFSLEGAHVEQTLKLAGLKAGSLDIGSADHGGFPTWGAEAKLNLRDATATTLDIADEGSADRGWPPRIDLKGFAYEHLPGLEHGWLNDWLKRDSHSAQPYQQAARVLTDQGEARLADRLLFDGRERQRRGAPPLQQATDWVAKLTIGYGIGARYFYSLAWALLLSSIGALVFAPAVNASWHYAGAPLLFSLDELLPIIDVSPGADEIAKHLTGNVLWYLAFHRACGFLLGTFIIAGLTGLTKK